MAAQRKRTAQGVDRARRRAAGAALAGAGLAVLGGLRAGPAQAQPAWPSRPVTLIVPFASGNVTDSIARMIGERLAAALGQQVVIDNRPGASGGIGMSAITRAAPDGYTIGMGAIGPMALNPALYSRLPYDPQEGLSVISVVYKGPTLILVLPGSPLTSVADLVKASRAQAGGMDYATAGIGSSMHLTGEWLNRALGAQLRHVPNRGSGAAALLLLGREVPVLLDSSTAALNYVRSGQMRALAVTSAQRLKALPDVPTLAEAGFPGVVVDGWLSLIAPKGLAEPVRQRLSDEVRKIMQDSEVRDRIAAQAGEAVVSGSEESAQFVRAEQRRWAELVRAVGIKLD